MPEPLTLLLLLAWATLAGVDLVSWPQGLLSRPLVVGTVAGLLLDAPLAGLQVGAVLELYALDVLPVGASRYPDYAAATVGGVVVAAGMPAGTFGLGVGLGLVIAILGAASIAMLRRRNTALATAAGAGLATGEVAVVRRLQWLGLAGDVVRSAALGAVALGLAVALLGAGPDPALGRMLAVSLTGAGVAAAGAGALRSAGRGLRLRWLAVGSALGLLWVAVR